MTAVELAEAWAMALRRPAREAAAERGHHLGMALVEYRRNPQAGMPPAMQALAKEIGWNSRDGGMALLISQRLDRMKAEREAAERESAALCELGVLLARAEEAISHAKELASAKGMWPLAARRLAEAARSIVERCPLPTAEEEAAAFEDQAREARESAKALMGRAGMLSALAAKIRRKGDRNENEDPAHSGAAVAQRPDQAGPAPQPAAGGASDRGSEGGDQGPLPGRRGAAA